MAQHIPLEKIKLKGFQNIYKSICKNFQHPHFSPFSSLKYEEIRDERYKEFENDRVFVTNRSVNGKREIFEVHFDIQANKFGNVYLVK